MLKRCLSPLTLVNQLALNRVAVHRYWRGRHGDFRAGWCNGVQGSAHAINKAGSLRMQSYRLLAAVPLNAERPTTD